MITPLKEGEGEEGGWGGGGAVLVHENGRGLISMLPTSKPVDAGEPRERGYQRSRDAQQEEATRAR